MKNGNTLTHFHQRLFRNAKRQYWISLLAASIIGAGVFAGSAVCWADSHGKAENSDGRAATATIHCDVENFGQVNDFYFRGAQPREDQYAELAAIGVKTVIDLRDDPKAFAKGMAEKAGLKYINFPLSDTKYPRADAAEKFLELVNDKENQPVYVHCAGGRHRTGIMTAVYRLTMEGWNIDKAYSEMKQYDFYTRWGHEAMKKYIFDYSRTVVQKQPDASFELPLSSPSEAMQTASSARARRVTEEQR